MKQKKILEQKGRLEYSKSEKEPENIKEEIVKYMMRKNGPVTQTELCKKLRKNAEVEVQVRPQLMKKKLRELVKEGKIFPKKVGTATYYYLVPEQCSKSKKIGIPKFILKNEEKYAKFLVLYYATTSLNYITPLEHYYSILQKKWSRLLKEDLDTKKFLALYQAWQENSIEIDNEIKKIGDKTKSELKNYKVLFLEELTLSLFEFIINYGGLEPICEKCKSKVACSNKSIYWIERFFRKRMNIDFDSDLPNNKLKKFWKDIRLGNGIPYKYLEDYFSVKFFIDDENNPFIFLKQYEDEKAKEFFYSKIIPFSVGYLVEEIIKNSKYLHELCNDYKKILNL